MTKKNFTGGLSSLLGEEANKKPKRGRPKTNFKEPKNASAEGTKENEIRATFIVNEKKLQELKNIAYWERLKIKEVVDKALGEYLERYIEKKGEIKPKQ